MEIQVGLVIRGVTSQKYQNREERGNTELGI
jgi:hypothetical protein